MSSSAEGIKLLERMQQATKSGLVLMRAAVRTKSGTVRAIVDGELRAMTKDDARAGMRAGKWLPAGEVRAR